MGPYFEWDGDLMGAFASTNGDPKSNFLKIYLNELIPWNTEEKNYGKTPSQSVASFGVHVYRLKLVLGNNGDLEKKWGPFGDPKSEKGPHGSPGPQMGTHLGAVKKAKVIWMHLKWQNIWAGYIWFHNFQLGFNCSYVLGYSFLWSGFIAGTGWVRWGFEALEAENS